MTTPNPPRITSPSGPDHRGAADLRLPSRYELTQSTVEVLKRGGRSKADLLVVDLGQGQLVVKDFGGKGWWARLLGRMLISRECRAYRWLGPLPGIPRLVGRVDAHALATERIDAVQLNRSHHVGGAGSELLERLREVVDRLHAAGLAHLDLRGRENVIIDAEGRVFVLDLAGAVWLRPRSLAHRLFFGWLKLADDSALLKWKRLLGTAPYTDQEQAFLRRWGFWRSLWPFNRKRGPGEGKYWNGG